MARETLPSRRYGVTIEFDHVTEWGPNNLAAKSQPYRATLGYYRDGRLGEIFVESARKVSTQADIAIKDAAIALSIGLQHGVQPDDLVDSFLHDAVNRPEGALGQLLKLLRDQGLLRADPDLARMGG